MKEIVRVIKDEIKPSILVKKYGDDSINMGSQLVVYPGQTAFFIKGGKICDEFTSGTYTIKSDNIPILRGLINLPFGGDSPFQADVWFVNQVSILDCKWGTTTPIQVEDPKYGIIIPLRAYGQYGFHISKPRVFLERLIGNLSSFSTEALCEYFKGVILTKLTQIISDKVNADRLSLVNICSNIIQISEYARMCLAETLNGYGIHLEMFNVISINVNESDPSFIKLKQAIDERARIEIMGRDNYQMERSFNVLDKAASNTSGGLISSAVGIGAGVGIGGQIGTLVGSQINTNSQMPPAIPQTQYFLGINGQQYGPFDFNTIIQYQQSRRINSETLIWKAGMTQWERLGCLREFSGDSSFCPPPIPKA